MKRRLHIIVGAGAMLTLFIGIHALATTISLNASYSAPHWGYFRLPIALWPFEMERGDWIQFTPPVDAPWPYVKQVRGIGGDVVEVKQIDQHRPKPWPRDVLVNGGSVGMAKLFTLSGRPVDAISPSRIPAGHFFVSAPHKDSHDSRYAEIGLIPHAAITARVWPLPDIPFLGLEGPFLNPDPAINGGRQND